MYHLNDKARMPAWDEVLSGRETRMRISGTHHVTGHATIPPFPKGMERALFGLGCFWGAEKCFWQIGGVYATAVGYAAGYTQNPTYEEVCSGRTGHNEVVLVVFDPSVVSYEQLLKAFWEAHDPTQGMQQGNDIGTQYRSGIYCYGPEQQAVAERSRDRYQQALTKANLGTITTEVLEVQEFYYAEEYHQQYLAKNPGGYCGLGGLGIAFD